MIQPDLFGGLHAERRPKRSFFAALPGRFLRVKVAYEDVVFVGLGLVLMVLAGFCLGVERGKRLDSSGVGSEPAWGVAAAEGNVPRAAAAVREPARAKTAPMIPVAVSLAPAAPRPVPEPKEPSGGYAIQLASYVGIQSAQEEAKRLGRKGVRAEVIPQGRFYELRAVGFASKSQASETLAMLRKTYKDAFVKRRS